MTQEEFEEIIKPLALLDLKQREFLTDALIGNFQKWKQSKENTQEHQWSERKKATFAFFDKLPDGLREMAKENYEEIESEEPINNVFDAICWVDWFSTTNKMLHGDWRELAIALHHNHPSITLNGTTYDLTKCYE